MPTDTAADRARRRIRDEMGRLHLSQTDLARRLRWTQTRISKVLSGRTALGVDELDALCFGVGLRLTEAVRDHGLEFCAELTPLELRMLERMRQLPDHLRDSLLELVDTHQHTRLEARGATKRASRLKRVR